MMTRILSSLILVLSFSACAGGVDENGNPLPELAMNETGQPVLDMEGNPIEEPEVMMSEWPTDEELEASGAEKAYENGTYKTVFRIQEQYGTHSTNACCWSDNAGHVGLENGLWTQWGRRNYRPSDGARWNSTPWWSFSGFGTCYRGQQSNFWMRC